MSIVNTYIAVTRSYAFYSSIVIVTIGIIGNIFNIFVFTNPKLFRENPCCFYLTFESLINIGTLLFTCFTNIVSTFGINFVTTSTYWCKIKSVLGLILEPVSLSTICFAAIDQFLSTSPIFYIRQLSTVKLARRCVSLSVCFWILHSIPIGIYSDVYMRMICIPLNPIYLDYHLYFYYPVLLGILPNSISSLFSLLAFRNVRRIISRHKSIVRHRLDQQMTALVFVRVIVLIALYMPYIIYYIYIFAVAFPVTNLVQVFFILLMQTISYSLVFLNHAISFYIFLISSSRFRRQVKYLLLKKFWTRCKRICRFNQNQINPLQEKPIESPTNIE